MTIRAFREKVPRIAESAWVSEAAYVIGDVEIGEGSSIWPGAVIRADFRTIRVGNNTHIEDNCVVHAGPDIGDNVVIGHGVIVHCKSIGNNCLIGNNATLLDGAEIDDDCVVAAGTLVLPSTKIPPRSLVMGMPATVNDLSASQLERLENQSPDKSVYARLARPFHLHAGFRASASTQSNRGLATPRC